MHIKPKLGNNASGNPDNPDAVYDKDLDKWEGGTMEEKDYEIYGEGNVTAAEFWEYDARLGRRWNTDPLSYKMPWQSTYSTFNNSPLLLVDIFGLKAELPNKKTVGTIFITSSTVKSGNEIYKKALAPKTLEKYKNELKKTMDKSDLNFEYKVVPEADLKNLKLGENDYIVNYTWKLPIDKAFSDPEGESEPYNDGSVASKTSKVYVDANTNYFNPKNNADKAFVMGFTAAHELTHQLLRDARATFGLPDGDDVEHTNGGGRLPPLSRLPTPHLNSDQETIDKYSAKMGMTKIQTARLSSYLLNAHNDLIHARFDKLSNKALVIFILNPITIK